MVVMLLVVISTKALVSEIVADFRFGVCGAEAVLAPAEVTLSVFLSTLSVIGALSETIASSRGFT